MMQEYETEAYRMRPYYVALAATAILFLTGAIIAIFTTYTPFLVGLIILGVGGFVMVVIAAHLSINRTYRRNIASINRTFEHNMAVILGEIPTSDENSNSSLPGSRSVTQRHTFISRN